MQGEANSGGGSVFLDLEGGLRMRIPRSMIAAVQFPAKGFEGALSVVFMPCGITGIKCLDTPENRAALGVIDFSH